MNLAVLTMHVGGRRVVVVPPALGYGQKKVGIVPSNSTLIYDIELLHVKRLDLEESDYGYSDLEDYDYNEGSKSPTVGGGGDRPPVGGNAGAEAEETGGWFTAETVAMLAVLVIMAVVMVLAVFGQWLNTRHETNPRFQSLHRDPLELNQESEMGSMIRSNALFEEARARSP